MTIVEFLSARLAEGEALALAATPGPWTNVNRGASGLNVLTVNESRTPGHEGYPDTVAHCALTVGHFQSEVKNAGFIAANDPAYVLADIAAKRRILGIYQVFRQHAGGLPGQLGMAAYEPVLMLLAERYDDHPDYQESWRLPAPCNGDPEHGRQGAFMSHQTPTAMEQDSERRAIAFSRELDVENWAQLDLGSRARLLADLRALFDLQLAETRCVPVFPAVVGIHPLGGGSAHLVVEQRCLPPVRFADWPSDHPLPRMCRICGCDDHDCCTGQPCSWVADDLCSACV